MSCGKFFLAKMSVELLVSFEKHRLRDSQIALEEPITIENFVIDTIE